MAFKRSGEEKARRSEEKSQRRAHKAQKTEIARARVKIKRLEWEHRSAVKDAASKLKDAEGKPLASLEKASDFVGPSLKVFADRVETPKGTHPLTADLSARVEGSGRGLVVLIDGDEWGYTHDPHPDDAKDAHDFARDFNGLVTRLPLDVPEAVKQARDLLNHVSTNRSVIDAAEAELRALEAAR